MKKLSLYSFLIALTFVFACGSGDKSTSSTDSVPNPENTTTENTSGTFKKYTIKSGKVTYKSETMGMPATTIIYFDDFGAKEATETIMEIKMMGVTSKTHSISIIKDGYVYNLDLEKKTGTKAKFLTTGNENVDYTNLSKEMTEKMKIKKEGSETILGKSCDIYSMDYSGMKGKTWVWSNIALKSNMEAMGVAVIMEATELKENDGVPASIFEVPADITITEI